MRQLVVIQSIDPETGEISTDANPQIDALRMTIINTPIDSLSYKEAIIGYISAFIEGSPLTQESLMRWLHGEEVTAADMRVLKLIGVTEKVNKTNAFRMLPIPVPDRART